MKKAMKTKFKKGTALLLSLALSVGQFQVLPHKVIDVQAQESSENKLSVTAFATKDELMTVFEADGKNETIGKIVFGKDSGSNPLEWYVLGKDSGIDGDNTAIFATSPISDYQIFEDNDSDNKSYEPIFGTYEHNPSEVYPNHYGASDLRVALQTLATNTDYFTKTEQSFMQATTVTTNDMLNSTLYTTTDILYALKGEYNDNKELRAGSKDDKVLPMNSYVRSGEQFWLRSSTAKANNAFAGIPGEDGDGLSDNSVGIRKAVRPASNINLSTVIFASAAIAAIPSIGTMVKGEITDGTAMTLRMDGSNVDIGIVTCDSTQEIVLAKKSSTATGTVSVVVQGNDGFKPWYYSKVVTDKVAIKASDLKARLGLVSDVKLSDCKIWVETTVDNVSYAKLATEGTIASEEISEVDSNYSLYNIEETSVKIMESGKYEIFGNGNVTTNRIDVMADGDVELIIRDVNIVASDCIRIKKGDVTLILSGVNILEPKGGSGIKASGIKAGNNPLTIEGSGYLKAVGFSDCGIFAKDITINSGTIEAYASSDVASAIGTSREENLKRIIINGGNVKAYANPRKIDSTTSKIRRGSTGIGSVEGDCGEIIITGGTIEAYGGLGPGIGGEKYIKSIKITGGNIIAHGGDDAAGIGTAYTPDLTSKVDSIQITGGNITAYGAKVGGHWTAAGIGGGRYATVGTISIMGGTINAIASAYAAGIGTGMNGICEKIEITGGRINATSGSYSAAIGLGAYDAILDSIYVDSYFGELLITGGIITVNALAYASVGIGAHESCCGNLGKMQISGGTIICNSKDLSKDIACEGAEKILVTGGNIQAERVPHQMVDDKGKKLVKNVIFVGKNYKDYDVTEINYEKYNLNDVKVNEDGYVTVYTPENEEVEICVNNQWFPKTITSVSLSETFYTYDGYAKKPSVTVKADTKKLTVGKDYKVTYKNNVNIGTASVTITGTGIYMGSITKTYKINLAKVTNLKQNTNYATNKIAMSWNKVKGADGYVIYRATEKNASYKYLKSVTANTYSNVCLKAGIKYYYKVRAYKNIKGKKVYGAYSDVKCLLTKPAAPTGFSVTLNNRTAKITWAKSTGAQGYEVYMSNSRNGSYTRIKNAGASSTAYNKTGLVKGKKYYFKMRAYTKTGTGAKVYSGYSKIKAVTVK